MSPVEIQIVMSDGSIIYWIGKCYYLDGYTVRVEFCQHVLYKVGITTLIHNGYLSIIFVEKYPGALSLSFIFRDKCPPGPRSSSISTVRGIPVSFWTCVHRFSNSVTYVDNKLWFWKYSHTFCFKFGNILGLF